MSDLLDELSTEELGKLFPIRIVAPDPEWGRAFREEKANILRVLGTDLARRVEHFGSTAVPGLAAKPTIDILVEIPPGEAVWKSLIQKMKAAGYHFIRREDCPPAYPMFVKGYSLQGAAPLTYHVHAAPASHSGMWDRLRFRDLLIARPEIARAYEALKRELAEKFPNDREAYTEGKTGFIRGER